MPQLNNTLLIRDLGKAHYIPVWHAMRHFTDHRSHHSFDEIWVVEHYPVFTQGQNGRAEHILSAGDIPIVQTDRGGQVTYHGPGQMIIYLLLDLRRRNVGARQLVRHIEASVVQCLALYGIDAAARPDAPGVYVNDAKICSLGLRVRRGCSYHGLAFNHDMDLSPFIRINPCGFKQLPITQLRDFKPAVTRLELKNQLVGCLRQILGYNALTQAENSLPGLQDIAYA
ncbi:MAG: lipB [Gammaproteobacteria bacterium]|jgi:lipoyl(octanoyl) transferase|nr:lipB [Gammaproteobacteria bacterium]